MTIATWPQMLAVLAVLTALGTVAIFAAFWPFRRPAIRPDDSKARADEDAKVKAAEVKHDEQKRQPLAEWINGRFGRKP